MRFVVDSSVLVAIFKQEHEGPELAEIIMSGGWLIGWPTIFETRIWLHRQRPQADLALLDLVIRDDGIRKIAFDGALESYASDAYSRFGKGRHPAKLNFGDCMAYAVAKHFDAPLLFKGNDFQQTDVLVHTDSIITD